MTIFYNILAQAKLAFPNYQMKFKDQSTFMKILGTIMFFTPGFMTEYLTTIGNTTYVPSQAYIDADPVSAATVLLHELVHVNDFEKTVGVFYSTLYLLPQLLVLLSIPILFLFGWKFALIPLIFLAPLPAYFRMVDEKRAYTVQLYVSYKIAQQNNLTVDLDALGTFCAQQFQNSYYYFMWPFSNVSQYFTEAVATVKSGGRPSFVEDSVYDTMDKIITG